jgi:hypothetical protein
LPNPITRPPADPAARPVAHIAILSTDPDSAGDLCTLAVHGVDADQNKTLIFHADLDDAPTTDPHRVDHAIAAANRILPNIGWTRRNDWEGHGHGVFTADLRPRYGLITVQLVACDNRDPLPGLTLGSDRIPEIPGLDDHPGVYEWKLAAGILTDYRMHVKVLPPHAPVEDHPTILVTLPLLTPAYDGTHFTVDLLDPARARALARLLTGRGRPADVVDDTTVRLTRSAVDVLGEIRQGISGHFDGEYVWWEHGAYPVEALTIEQLVEATSSATEAA